MIDYDKLHHTGIRRLQSPEKLMDQHELIGRLSILTSNIIDTLDENGPDSVIDE